MKITIILEDSDKFIPETKSLIDFLERKNIEWEFVKHPSSHDYTEIENQIDASTLTIIIIANGISDTTWVNALVQYCWNYKNSNPSIGLNYVGLETKVNSFNPSKNNFRDNSTLFTTPTLIDFLNVKMKIDMDQYCPCCDYNTFDIEERFQYNICPICYWEDDQIQFNDPSFKGGANTSSLISARKNFLHFYSSDEDSIKKCRKPNKNEFKKRFI